MIVVELVKIVPVHTPPATTVIQGRSLVLKCVKILSRKRHKLFEIGISIWACPAISPKQQCKTIVHKVATVLD